MRTYLHPVWYRGQKWRAMRNVSIRLVFRIPVSPSWLSLSIGQLNVMAQRYGLGLC